MLYPTRADYIDIIIPNLSRFAIDERARNGTPRRNKMGGPFFKQGGMAMTFPIEYDGATYAFRVWFTDLGDLGERYAILEKHDRQNCPWLLRTWYYKHNLFFKNSHYPALCMDWVEGETFEEILNKYHANSGFIRNIADVFLQLVREMHANNISHGDLQHGNIMYAKVPGKTPDEYEYEVKLVDYDSIWTPEMGDMPASTAGLPGYQHPLRKNFPLLKGKTDYFSELVMYLSLLAIAENPRRWTKVKDTGRLLFDVTDLRSPAASEIFRELKKSPSHEIRFLTEELHNFCREQDLNKLDPLETVVERVAAKTAVIEAAEKAAAEKAAAEREAAEKAAARQIDDNTPIPIPVPVPTSAPKPRDIKWETANGSQQPQPPPPPPPKQGLPGNEGGSSGHGLGTPPPTLQPPSKDPFASPVQDRWNDPPPPPPQKKIIIKHEDPNQKQQTADNRP